MQAHHSNLRVGMPQQQSSQSKHVHRNNHRQAPKNTAVAIAANMPTKSEWTTLSGRLINTIPLIKDNTSQPMICRARAL